MRAHLEVQLLAGIRLGLVVLVDDPSSASRAVQALIPKAVMPKWWRTARIRCTAVVQLHDLVDMRYRVTLHTHPFRPVCPPRTARRV